MSNQDYNADSIQILKGLEAVKKRPGMYIGNTDDGSGLHQMIYEAVDNAIDESFEGYCTEVSIILNKNGSCTISDNGRGIPVDMHEEGVSAAEVIMTHLHAGGKFNQNTYKISGGLHGVGISVVNALSEYLTLRIFRNGNIYAMEFNEGFPVQKLHIIDKTDKTGTEITFMPSNKIFDYCQFDFSILAKRFRELSYLNKVTIHLNDLQNDQSEIFSSKGGISSFVRDLNNQTALIHDSIIKIQNENVDIAMQWTEAETEKILCFTNNIPQKEGGSHLSGFKSGVTKVISKMVKDNQNLIGEDMREGLTAIVSVKIPDPRFDSQTKSKLVSSNVKRIVESLIVDQLSIWLEENKDDLLKIIEKMKCASYAREAAKRAREVARRRNEIEISSLPGKLSDCSNKDPASRELFIVEGDSAGGSAKQARDRRFQAILPLRGKVLNVAKTKFARVISSEQIGTLISALRTGIEKDFNIDNCRYHKVILMTDADIDGSHIRTLLLTFFFKYMKELIYKGYLYIAQPPLYGIKKKNSMTYLKDEDELRIYLLQFGLNGLKYKDIKIDEKINVNFIPYNIRNHIISTICNHGLDIVRENPNQFFNIQNNMIMYNQETEYTVEIIYNSLLDNVEWTKYKSLSCNDQSISLIELIHAAEKYARDNLYIQRFKGLGEMQSEQLWSTTLDPQNRTLLQVTINNLEEAEIILENLMGDTVEPRRRFIEENALYVQNLDA